MNKVNFLLLLLVFCSAGLAQNDTTRVNPPAPDSSSQKQAVEPTPTNTVTPKDPQKPNRKRPKGYDDYVNKGKRPTTDVTPFMDNVYYGCNLQLGAGSSNGASTIYYDISPHAGYKFNEYLSLGVQVIYNNTTYTFGTQRINYNIFGTGVFGRILILNHLFIQGEIDALSIPANYRGTTIVSRRISDEKMIGLGYKSPLGEKLGYFFVLMYDISPNFYSPYYAYPLVYRAGLSWNF